MMNTLLRTAFSLLCAAPLLAAPIQAEPTNFRVGLGMLRYDVHPAADYMPDFRNTGFTFSAEFPQDNYVGSRFIVYREDDDDVSLWGYETQLMWGYGLAQPGFRIYTGPAWHREVIRSQANGSRQQRVFNGWGWQLGTGWQIGAITLDVAATYRDPKDYRDENKRAGNNVIPDPILSNVLVSYRF